MKKLQIKYYIYNTSIQIEMQVEKIEKGSKITIQYCKSCETHSWCTHHNESKYKQTYLQLADCLKKQFKDLIVVGNQVPQHLVPIKARENKYYDSKDNKYVLFPAIGAFEVCWNGQLIFSKKNTNTWPLNSQIISQIYYKINGVPRKSETCQSVNSTQKYGISQKQQRQTVKLANHILENIDKNTTFYKEKAKKQMTLTDHFKRYKMKKKSEQDLQSLYAESESPKHHSKISKITPQDIQKLHQLWGKKENLPNFIKNKALIEEKEGGKKQMLVNLSSIEEQNEMKQIRVDVPKKNKKNKISNLEVQFEKLQKKFLKFQCRVSEVNNKNFDLTGSQVNKQRQKNHGKYSFMDKIQQIKTAYNPQKLVRLIKDKKKRKIEQYIHATLEQKNEKLEQIYGPQYLKPNLTASKVQPHNSKVEKKKKKKKMSGKQQRSLSKSNQTNNSKFSHQSSSRTQQIQQISEDSCSDILGQPIKRQTNTSYGRKTDNQFSSTSAGFKTQTKQTPNFEKQNTNNTKKSVQGITFLSAFEKQRRQFHSRSLLHKPIQQKINEKRKLDGRKSQQNQECVPNKTNQRRAEKTQKSSESRRQQASSLEKKKKVAKTLQMAKADKPSRNEQAKMLKKYRVNKKNDADNSRTDNVNQDEQRSEKSCKMNKSKSSSNKSSSFMSQSRSSMQKNKNSSRSRSNERKQQTSSKRTKKSSRKQNQERQSQQSPKTSKFKQNKKNNEKQNNLLITYDDDLSDSKQIKQSQQSDLFQSKRSQNRSEAHQNSRIKKKAGDNAKQSRIKKNSENESRSNRDDQGINSKIRNRNSEQQSKQNRSISKKAGVDKNRSTQMNLDERSNSNKSAKKRMKSQASNESSIGGKRQAKNSLNSSRSVNAERQNNTKKKQARNKNIEEQNKQKNKSRFSGDDEQERSDDNQNKKQHSQSQIKQMKKSKSKSKSLQKMKNSTISNNSKRDGKHKVNKQKNKQKKSADENDETLNKSDNQSQQKNGSEHSLQEENKKQDKQAKKVEHKQVNNVGAESKPKRIFEIDEEQPEMVDVGVQKNCKFGQQREAQTFGLTDRNPNKLTDNEQNNQSMREKEVDNIRQNEQISHYELDQKQGDQNDKQSDDFASNQPITHKQVQPECQQTDKSKCFANNASDMQKSKMSKQKANLQNKSRVISRNQAPYQRAAITKQFFSSHYQEYIDRLQIPGSQGYRKQKRQQILFSKQSIAPESLKDNTGKLANILKIISIICDKNQYLIVRLFQNVLAKDSSIFGIWLCQHYSWKCFWVSKSDLDSQLSVTHQDGQLWAPALVQALILMFDGLQKLAQVSLPELFHALTGSSFLNFKVKQDPEKNNRLLKFISQNEKKNFILVAQKRLPQQLKNTSQVHPYLQTYFILSQKNANNEILLRMKKAKSQAFWIKLQKFVTQFSQVDILQLRVAHNFGQVDIGCNGTDNYIIVQMEFKEQCFGCVVGVAGGQAGDFKMCLYREEQDSVLRLVGQLSDKNKKSSFFDCCFEEGRYYVFTKINSSQPNRVCYLGQGTPKMIIKQQIQEQSLKSSYTQYIPLSNMPAKRPSQQQIEMPKFLNMTRKSEKDSFFNIESGLSNEKSQYKQYKQSRAGKENVMNKEQIKAQFVKYLVNN